MEQAERQGTPLGFWMGYSVAERDRRWNAVRANAAKEGLDCVWVPLGNGTDGRYLTQFRAASIVLPTDGRPPIVVTDRGARNEWIPEPRLTGREWIQPMTQALLDLGMERARVGVVGLKGGNLGHVRAPDGVVNHSAFVEVTGQLPEATFVDATDVVGRVRFVKSDEEIANLRKAAEIAEAGVDELIEVARPGVDAAVLWARVMARMLEMGTEYYTLAIYTDPLGAPHRRRTEPPIGERLQPNAYITDEVSAVWGAQVSQEDQPVLLGPIPDEWKPVIELQREVFYAGLEAMKPGTTFGEFIDFINGFGEKRGMKTLTLMHGRGYGDDGPLITPRARGENVRDLPFQKGNAFVWKPYGMSADERVEFVWGGDVVVTDRGGEVLFKRPHGLISIT